MDFGGLSANRNIHNSLAGNQQLPAIPYVCIRA